MSLHAALPISESDIPALYHAAAEALLTTLESPRWPEREGAWTAAQSLFRLRWPWAQLVAQRISTPERAERWLFSKLPEWAEKPARAAGRAGLRAGRGGRGGVRRDVGTGRG